MAGVYDHVFVNPPGGLGIALPRRP